MNIIKDYLVTVRTINDGQATAIKITDTSNNLIKDFTSDEPLTNNGVSIGNVSANANENVLTETYENNLSITPMNIKKEDDLNQVIFGENPMKRDVIKKGDSRPISESTLVDNFPSNNQFNNISDHYKPIPIHEKKTASSIGKETQKYQVKSAKQQGRTSGGRKMTRKNKKKTKTMRRKRRNL